MKRIFSFSYISILILYVPGCLVAQKECYESKDCAPDEICSSQGKCLYECMEDSDCSAGFICTDHRCVPDESDKPIECPSDMVPINNTYCIDIYEASRDSATADDVGSGGTYATSRREVLPWMVPDNKTAADACELAGKRLCTAQEWEFACRGPDNTTYAYGEDYDPVICNGIDTYGKGLHHLMPTGSFPECTNEYGIFDINGNLWEHTLGGDATTVRGGAFNCIDSARLHRCDYIPGWTPSALGFRCCLSPVVDDDENPFDAGSDGSCLEEDAGTDADADSDIDADADADIDASWNWDASVGCPEDMAGVHDFCIDRFEASKGPGDVPVSEPGRMPWFTTSELTLDVVKSRCESAGKRVCTIEEWNNACGGKAGTVYGYGDEFEWEKCLGIDHFCNCDYGPCAESPNCPFDKCFTHEDSFGFGPCDLDYSDYGPLPTGYMKECHNDIQIYDMNGNVWEITDDNGTAIFKGGAYNCIHSYDLHRCNHSGNEGYRVNAKGFRCCRDRDLQ